jgi:alpha-glucosidase
VLDVAGRDGCRTPIPWEHGPNAGFTRHGVRPWLPMTDPGERNVAAQRNDPGSTLHLVRDLIALRRAEPDLRTGAYATLPAPAGAWVWRRGERFAVAVNLDDGRVTVEGLSGGVVLATDRAREGERVEGTTEVGPWEALVLRLS